MLIVMSWTTSAASVSVEYTGQNDLCNKKQKKQNQKNKQTYKKKHFMTIKTMLKK